MASRSIDSADVIQRRSYSGAGDDVDPVTRAIAEGRHSDRQEHLCQRCRNWCDGIWYGNKTYGIPDMCKRCYEDSGAAQMVLPIDPSITREYIKPVEVRPYQPTLAEHLLLWASEHYRDAFEAYSQRNDPIWERRVLAAIVRSRAAKERGWITWVPLTRWADELASLGEYVKRAGGYPMVAGMTFAEWVNVIRELGGGRQWVAGDYDRKAWQGHGRQN